MLRVLLAVALFVTAGITLTPRPAAAAGSYLDVSITQVSTPTLDLSDPEARVSISGTVTNVSTQPIRYSVVHFWRSPRPLTTQAEVAAGLANPPAGERLFKSDDNLAVLSREDSFGPGEQKSFTVTGTIGELTTEGTPLSATDVAYLLGVQVVGTPDDTTGRLLIGRDTIAIAATTEATRSSSIALLTTSATAWSTDGTFPDASLEADLRGRLDTLLASAERGDVVAAIDPALYLAASTLSGAHEVDGEDAPGSGIALRWVQRVDALAEQNRLWRLPFGNPDLARAQATGQLSQVLAAAKLALPSDLSHLPSVAVLTPGSTSDILPSLRDFTTVVIAGGSGSQAGSPNVIAGAEAPTVEGVPDGLQVSRRVVDELLAPRPPLYLIATPEDAALDEALTEVHTRTAPTALPQTALVWPKATTVAPWTQIAEALKQATGDAHLFASLTGTAPVGTAALTAAAYGAGFPLESDAVAWVRANMPPPVDKTSIRLRVAKSLVMGSKTNNFPATLTNELDLPVTVMVRFSSDTPQRIRVPDTDAVTVQPGESLTLNIVPQASSNGVSLVRGQVTTLSGVPIGQPVTVEITATDLGRIGWVIIVICGAVVLGGTAWRIRTVRRDRGPVAPATDKD